MELTVEAGKGYVPASMNPSGDAPIGLVPVDALYSPVRQVSYKVENTRVGQELDYRQIDDLGRDRRDAVARRRPRLCGEDPSGSARAVRHFEEPAHGYHAPVSTGGGMPLGRSRSTTRRRSTLPAQEGRRARTVGPLGQLPEDRQHHLHRRPRPEERERDARTPNFGRKSLNEIKEVLQAMGLHLGMQIDGWPPENIEEMAKKLEQEY